MISVPQLCKNRLEDVTNLSNTFLLPIVVQLYEFHGKPEKEKALKHQKQESNEKGCVGKFTER